MLKFQRRDSHSLCWKYSNEHFIHKRLYCHWWCENKRNFKTVKLNIFRWISFKVSRLTLNRYWWFWSFMFGCNHSKWSKTRKYFGMTQMKFSKNASRVLAVVAVNLENRLPCPLQHLLQNFLCRPHRTTNFLLKILFL